MRVLAQLHKTWRLSQFQHPDTRHLNDAALRLIFRESLRDTYCEENLLFYLDVGKFLTSCEIAIKASSPAGDGGESSGQSLDSVKKTMSLAYGIHNAFLAPGSPCELNTA